MALTVSITVSSSDYAIVFAIQARVEGLRITTGAHGYESMVCFYPCSTVEAFEIYSRPGLPHVRVTDQGMTIWEGRLEDVAIVDGGVRLGAFGYQRALSDTLYTASFSAASTSSIAGSLIASVSGSNGSQLSSSTTLVSSNSVTVTEAYNDMRPAAILNKLAGYGDTSGNVWEWGVYEQQTLFFRQRGSAGRAWYVDATSLELERSLDNLYNSAYATYTGSAANTTSRTAATTDATSITRYGITRQAVVNAQAKDSAAATYQAATFLADNKDATPRAKIAFDAVYDSAGGKWPLYYMRAGDNITIRNLPPTISSAVDKVRTFYISRTDYSADNDALTIEPTNFTPTIDNQISAGAGNAAGGVDADPRTYTDTVISAWTPAFTGLTVVGSVTYAGRYIRVGNLVYWQATITAGGANTTASTATTTYINNLPFTAGQAAVLIVSTDNVGNFGTGYVGAGATNAYTPTWAASNRFIVISGVYEV